MAPREPMKTAMRLSVAALLLLAVFCPMPPAVAQSAVNCERAGTPLEAKALAEKAAAHLANKGVGKAFNDFMTRGAGFMPHDLYVFVFDRTGRMWVNGGFPGMIGSSITEARDDLGRLFLLEAMRKADQDGAAWVEYQWFNPCNGKPMPKSTHIIKAGEFFIGVGAYGRLRV